MPASSPGSVAALSQGQKSRAEALAQALRALEQAEGKLRVATAITHYLDQAYGRGIVFIVKGDLALGWQGAGSSIDEAVVEATMIPLASPSAFREAVDEVKTYRGPVPPEGRVIHNRLCKLLHAAEPQEILVSPISLGTRVVNLIYTQSSPDAALPMMAEADMARLAAAAGAAYQRLIRLVQGAKSAR